MNAATARKPSPPMKGASPGGARQLQLPLAASERRAERSSAPRTARRARPTPSTETPAPVSRRQTARPARALPSGGPYRRLDERTRRVGLEGIAAARALLHRDRPIDASDKTCSRPERAA